MREVGGSSPSATTMASIFPLVLASEQVINTRNRDSLNRVCAAYFMRWVDAEATSDSPLNSLGQLEVVC